MREENYVRADNVLLPVEYWYVYTFKVSLNVEDFQTITVTA